MVSLSDPLHSLVASYLAAHPDAKADTEAQARGVVALGQLDSRANTLLRIRPGDAQRVPATLVVDTPPVTLQPHAHTHEWMLTLSDGRQVAMQSVTFTNNPSPDCPELAFRLHATKEDDALPALDSVLSRLAATTTCVEPVTLATPTYMVVPRLMRTMMPMPLLLSKLAPRLTTEQAAAFAADATTAFGRMLDSLTQHGVQWLLPRADAVLAAVNSDLTLHSMYIAAAQLYNMRPCAGECPSYAANMQAFTDFVARALP